MSSLPKAKTPPKQRERSHSEKGDTSAGTAGERVRKAKKSRSVATVSAGMREAIRSMAASDTPLTVALLLVIGPLCSGCAVIAPLCVLVVIVILSSGFES